MGKGEIEGQEDVGYDTAHITALTMFEGMLPSIQSSNSCKDGMVIREWW